MCYPGCTVHMPSTTPSSSPSLYAALTYAQRLYGDRLLPDGRSALDLAVDTVCALQRLSLDLPQELYIAALLIDSVEYTGISREELREYMGEEVAALVEVMRG